MEPLVPVVLSQILGIMAARHIAMPPWYGLLLLLFLSASALIAPFLLRRKFRVFYITPFFFLLGALSITPYLHPELPEGHILNVVRENENAEASEEGPSTEVLGLDVEGVVAWTPEPLEADGVTRVRLVVDALKVRRNGIAGTSGKVLLNAPEWTKDLRRGEVVRFVTKLSEPRNYGNPGEFDYRAWLNFRGIYATGFIKSDNLIVRAGGNPWPPITERLREGIRGFIDGSGVKHGEPLKALIIGDRRSIDRSLEEAFRASGTAHILSISGLHVGIVALFSYASIVFLLKRSETLLLYLNVRKTALALSIAPVTLYALLSGFEVPTRRAYAMAVVFALAFLLDRGRSYYNTLAAAAFVILLMAPYALWDAGFQLTFAAVLAIMYITPRARGLFSGTEAMAATEEKGMFGKRLGRIRERAILSFSVTLAASLGTYPVLACHFHTVSISGLAANFFIVPVAGVTVPLLFISSVLIPLSGAAAGAALKLADLSFDLIAFLARFFSGLPYSSIRVSTPTALEVLLFYVLTACVFNLKKAPFYRYGALAVVAAFGINAVALKLIESSRETLRVTFISVGHGDSIFVEFPKGPKMLVDGGGFYSTGFDTGEMIVAPFLWSRKVTSIDYLVLSHPQRDHMAGLRFIAKNFKVGEFWWNGDTGAAGLVKKLTGRGVRARVVDGDTVGVDINGVRVDFLHPFKGASFDRNNMSLVMRLRYGDRSFLLTGDIGEDAEREILKRDVRATVLKAPHHGSRTSSTEAFLSRVGPEVVVISTARKGVFGFPHEDVLRRYSSMGAMVLRTDIDGAVTVETDGKNLSVYGNVKNLAPQARAMPGV